MKATGIVRRIDDLGRIVIPKEIRRTMRIREGDPLEIYTDKEGEVIFKKYSPMGELNKFAEQLCESIYQTTEFPVCICDREEVIAAAGPIPKDIVERRLSFDMEQVMSARRILLMGPGQQRVPVAEMANSPSVSLVVPVISASDILGCVAFLDKNDGSRVGELETKLASTIAGFLSKQMSN